MKKIFTLLCISLSLYSSAQTICGSAPEGGSATLTAPAGMIFTSIQFASYGTPNGSCGSFTVGGCNAVLSATICATALIGKNSGTISADNLVFGDPCPGTVKRLYVQAVYAWPLPLKLVSFAAQKIDAGKIRLNWTSENEMNSLAFIVERSTNGTHFEETNRVNARGTGNNQYASVNLVDGSAATYFYRLKMLDIDGRFEYSNVVRVDTKQTAPGIVGYPSQVNNLLTIVSNKAAEATIVNSTGQPVKTISLINGGQTFNVTDLQAGSYFIVSPVGTSRFIKL